MCFCARNATVDTCAPSWVRDFLGVMGQMGSFKFNRIRFSMGWASAYFWASRCGLLIYIVMTFTNNSIFWCYWWLTWYQSQRSRVWNPLEAYYLHLSSLFSPVCSICWVSTFEFEGHLFILFVGFQIRSSGVLIYIVMMFTSSSSFWCC